MDPETLVRQYLGDLEEAASDLAPDRRAELVGDVRGHIDLALADAGNTDEATVRAVLERLGTPGEIVAAEAGVLAPALEGPRPMEATAHDEARRLSLEARALILLTVGSVVLPFIGPVLGLWIASASERWTLTQKRTAALVVFVLLAMPTVLLVPAIAAGEITWVFTSGGFLLPFVPLAGFLAATYLVVSTSFMVRVSRRP